MAQGSEKGLGGGASFSGGGYDRESEDNDLAQDQAMAAAVATGVPGIDDSNFNYTDRERAFNTLDKQTYNVTGGITETNPFGWQGFFSRTFGINPKNIDYSDIYDTSQNNPFIAAGGKYGLYANPFNQPGKIGYRADIAQPPEGRVREGLQSGIFSNAGQPTTLGTLADYDTAFSGMDRLAMTAMPMGFLAQVLGGKQTGVVPYGATAEQLIAATPQGALAPTPEMAAQGQTYGGVGRQLGLGIGQFGSALSEALNTAKDLITQTKEKNITAPEVKQKQAPDLSGFEQRFNTPPQKTERDRMMEALGIPTDKIPAPTNFGLASIPTTQVAEAPSSGLFQPVADFFGQQALSPETRSWMESQGITYDQLMNKQIPAGTVMPNGQIYNPPVPTPAQVSPQDLQNRIKNLISGIQQNG